MDLHRRLAKEARENDDRRFTAFALAFFAALTTFGTATRALDGTFTLPVIGLNAMMLYGTYLGFQGWRQRETRLSCAAMLMLPGLYFAAHILK
ncbi:hypothetical protein [Streptomyces sp. NPDC016845]|uniref:hypothetical protein n=1 Tax=Streptomyces sp. NPDC016845 TaxID=3364972 RepID=UPI00379C7C4B